jgi:hypothetical protein
LDRFQIGVHFLARAAAFALAVPIGWDREKRALCLNEWASSAKPVTLESVPSKCLQSGDRAL